MIALFPFDVHVEGLLESFDKQDLPKGIQLQLCMP